MKQILLLLMILGMFGLPALAQTYYLSPDVPTALGGTTYQPWDIVRNASGIYSLKLSFPANTAIDSLHQMCSGDWLISVEVPTILGGTLYQPQDVIRYNPVAGIYALYFSGAVAGVPAGSNLECAFLNGGDSASLILGFDVPTMIGAITYDPADLVRYSGGVFSLFFDASGTLPPISISSDVTGADQRMINTIITFDIPTKLGALTFLPGELASWNGISFSSFYADPNWPISSRVNAFAFPADPGRVPPPTLRVKKSSLTPGDLTISWGASTSAGAEDYGIYEGTIGSWYSHTAIDCSDNGADRVEEITPAAGNSYYLVVPYNGNDEGSYGKRSSGAERPQGTSPCRATQGMNCP